MRDRSSTAALMAARRFNSHIVGLHSLTTEYAVVFGGEMGFSISSEVDRTLEREGHERRDQARRLFREFMDAKGVPIGVPAPGHNGPSASWREEDGRQNAVVGMIGRVYDLILVEQPEKLASIAEATLEDALFESGRPVLMVPKDAARTDGRGRRDRLERQHRDGADRRARHAVPETGARSGHRRGRPAAHARTGSDGEELAAHARTARHRCQPADGVSAGRRPQGESFLKEAMAAGADLLLKGAYTQSRIRQMIFGGGTRHIIMEAQIPVLMAR